METAIKISQAAVEQYIDPNRSFSVASISKNAGVSKDEFYENFSGKTEALHFFYSSIPHRYRDMISEIPGYDDLSAGEKLANYLYSVFDMLEEYRDFADETFDPFVFTSWQASEFQTESQKLVTEFLESDPNIPPLNQMALNLPVDRILTYEMLHVIKFWLGDTSPQTERSAELVEKLTAFIDEMLHTAVMDRGYDLAKFMISNRVFGLPLPVIGRFIS